MGSIGYGIGLIGPILLVLFLILPILFLLLLFKVLMRLAGGGGSRDRREDDLEARTIQDLHAQMERMEKRIESLETILLDRVKKRREE